MATEVVKIVDPDNGTGTDYTSLAAWESGEQRDLVSANEIAIAKCRCTSGSADTSRLVIDGWTADSTRYIKIWTDPTESYRHPGKYDTSKFRVELTTSTYTELIYIFVPYTKIIGLQVNGIASSSWLDLIVAQDADQCQFISCIGKQSGSTKYGGFCGSVSASGVNYKIYMRNCIVYDVTTAIAYNGCFPIFCDGSGSTLTAYLYNCTAVDSYIGYSAYQASTTMYRKNCGSSGCTYDKFNASGTYYDTTCSSSTPTFVDAANDDFHLAPTDSTWKDAGTDLSSDSEYPFSDDIDGQTRSGAWDIGADEYVAQLKQYSFRFRNDDGGE